MTEITLKDLAKSIDDLAAITAKGFERANNDLTAFKEETRENFKQVNNDLAAFKAETRANFAVFREETRTNFTIVRGDIDRLFSEVSKIKFELERIKTRTLEDDGVLSSDLMKLQKRVNFLEKELKTLKVAKA